VAIEILGVLGGGTLLASGLAAFTAWLAATVTRTLIALS
jgi:hypothetical protein